MKATVYEGSGHKSSAEVPDPTITDPRGGRVMTATVDAETPTGHAPTGRWLVRDVMTTQVATVGLTTLYHDVVETLADRSVSAVPVIDARRRVLGVVSEADLLHKLEVAGLEAHRRLLDGRRRRTDRAKADARTAGELMTEPAVVVRAHLTIAAAAGIMEREGVKRLPVVDSDGRLVGIVSRADLLRVYQGSDEDLRDEIVGPILYHVLGIAPGTLEVTVANGVVSLGGAVGRRSTISIAIRLVQGVPGVVEVLDHLSYRYDDRPEHRR